MRVICFGAAHWDVIARRRPGARGPDAPGEAREALGGVALNAALGLARQGLAVELVAALGEDDAGRRLLEAAHRAGVGVRFCAIYPGAETGRYVAVERADGELISAVADLAALEAMRPADLDLDALPEAEAWLMEANLPPAILRALADHPRRPPLYADAASEEKAAKLRERLPLLAGVYANRLEAEAICAAGFGAARAAAEALVGRGAGRAVVTDGARPAADAGPQGVAILAPEAGPPASRTGSGDRLLAAHLAATLRGAAPEAALEAGLVAAAGGAA